jgi:hypothetical protein
LKKEGLMEEMEVVEDTFFLVIKDFGLYFT